MIATVSPTEPQAGGASAPRAAVAADTASVYEIRRLNKFYGQSLHVLKDVNITLRKGTFASVIGASGCGKSTLLKIMAGLLSPGSGSVRLMGSPVMGPRRDIGMMFQQATMFPWRSVISNILLPIEIRDGRRAAQASTARARELMELVGLKGFEQAYPAQLSGGMLQRAAICRMLITKPSVLLLDEPFSALDEIVRDFMNMELQRICIEQNATAFLVTHSIPEAVILSDTVYVMAAKPGRVAAEIQIDLPRPRTLDMMLKPEFAGYVRQIRALLDQGGGH